MVVHAAGLPLHDWLSSTQQRSLGIKGMWEDEAQVANLSLSSQPGL